MCFIPSIAMSTCSNKRTSNLLIQITDQEKEKYFLYIPIESVESNIHLFTSYFLLIAKKVYLVSTILKGSEILECKEDIFNMGKSQKGGKTEVLWHEKDQLIKSAISIFEKCLYLKFFYNQPPSFSRIANQMGHDSSKNRLGCKAMNCTSDVLKVYHESHQLLYLPKNAATLLLTHMQYYLKKPQVFGVISLVCNSWSLVRKWNKETSRA